MEYRPSDGMDVYDENTGACYDSDKPDEYDDWDVDECYRGEATGTIIASASGGKMPKKVKFQFISANTLLDDEGEPSNRRMLEKAWGPAVKDSGIMPTGNEGAQREFWCELRSCITGPRAAESACVFVLCNVGHAERAALAPPRWHW